jgi:hypothetical protein
MPMYISLNPNVFIYLRKIVLHIEIYKETWSLKMHFLNSSNTII